MAFGGGSGGTGDTGSGPGRSEGRNRDNSRGGRSGGAGGRPTTASSLGKAGGVNQAAAEAATEAVGGFGGGGGGQATGIGRAIPGEEASTGSFLEGIVSKAISGLAGIAGTALAGPIGGIAASAGMEALLGDDIGLGDLGLDLGEPGATNVGARRSPVPGTDRDQSGSLLGRAIGPGGETQPQSTPSAGVNTTTGQGGVARGSTQVSGRTGQVPASRSLLSSLATTSRKSLLGV